MGKNKESKHAAKPEQTSKKGLADLDAWEAAKQVAKALRKARKQDEGTDEWRKQPWREIREQLRSKGHRVDLDAVPPTWTSESPQMQDLRRILEQAGFLRQGNCYYWGELPAAAPAAVLETETLTVAEPPAELPAVEVVTSAEPVTPVTPSVG